MPQFPEAIAISSSQSKIAFNKPWQSYAQQVQLLSQRGLIVKDPAAAERFLSHLNYYRFSGYCLAFEVARHSFVPGATFEQILHAYEFDLALRDLLTEALEVIEVDLRAAVAYHFGRTYGAFGHTELRSFHLANKKFRHADWLTKVQEETTRSNERFVKHFNRTYQEYPDLPVWIATEIMSFGCLSRMIEGMLKNDQKQIAQRYGLQPQVFGDAIHHLVYVRNLCAHHSRVWDRIWAIKPTLPSGNFWKPPYLQDNSRVFSTLLLIRHFLKPITCAQKFVSDWKSKLFTHLNSLPVAPNASAHIGLSSNWQQNPTWV